jgi:iron complex transport system permease protein
MTDPDTSERSSSRGLLLAGAALVWMAAMLWSARATITGGVDAETTVTNTAYALPGAVSASLVAGAAVGLAVVTLITRGRALGSTTRFVIAIVSGLIVGLLGALVIFTINTEGWVFAVVAGTVAAAATVGSALGGFRAPHLVSAVCWAALAVFVLGFVLNTRQVQSPLLSLLGSGKTQTSQASAAQWFTFLQSVLSGLAAGLVGYFALRRARRRGYAVNVPWPFYAIAGAGPGLFLVVGEVLTRTAGSRVIDLAGQVSVLELVVQKMLGGARLNSALIILFVGAISAIIAFGRTLKPAVDEEAEEAEEQAAIVAD